MDPIDWDAHARIMAQVHFSKGLRTPASEHLAHTAGLTAIHSGHLAAIAAPNAGPRFPRSWTVGVYRDFCVTAAKPG